MRAAVVPVKRPAGGRTPALTGAISSPLPDTPLCEGEGRGFPLLLAGRVSTDARGLTARMHRAKGVPLHRCIQCPPGDGASPRPREENRGGEMPGQAARELRTRGEGISHLADFGLGQASRQDILAQGGHW